MDERRRCVCVCGVENVASTILARETRAAIGASDRNGERNTARKKKQISVESLEEEINNTAGGMRS